MQIVEGRFKGGKAGSDPEGSTDASIPVPELQDPLLTSAPNPSIINPETIDEILDFPQVPAYLAEDSNSNPDPNSAVERPSSIDETKLITTSVDAPPVELNANGNPIKRRRSRTKLDIIKGIPLEIRDPTKGHGPVGGRKLQDQIPKERIVRSLLRNYGILSEVAIECKCSLANISTRIKNNPDLQEWRRLAEERAKDKVEVKILKKAIMDEDPMMLRFYAKTKMKDRGYIEEDRVGTNDKPLVIEIVPAGSLPLQQAVDVQFEEVRP
jgi:hypothetical protein